MKPLTLPLLPVLLAATLGGCSSSPTASVEHAEIDSISRNTLSTQGGSVRDPYTLSAPPIRREEPSRPTAADR